MFTRAASCFTVLQRVPYGRETSVLIFAPDKSLVCYCRCQNELEEDSSVNTKVTQYVVSLLL
jgi:hypothetical protein